MLPVVLAHINSSYSYKYLVAFWYFKSLFKNYLWNLWGIFGSYLGLLFLQCFLGGKQVSGRSRAVGRIISSSAKPLQSPTCLGPLPSPWVHFHLAQIWKVSLASASGTVGVGLTHPAPWVAFGTESSNLSKHCPSSHQLRVGPRAFSLFDREGFYVWYNDTDKQSLSLNLEVSYKLLELLERLEGSIPATITWTKWVISRLEVKTRRGKRHKNPQKDVNSMNIKKNFWLKGQHGWFWRETFRDFLIRRNIIY